MAVSTTTVGTAGAGAARVPVVVKATYGVGAVADAVKAFSFGLFLLFFYTSVLGVPGTLVGLATALGLAWDAVIDPCIGFLSDRLKDRVGRHVFMLVGAIGSGLAFWAVFDPPDTTTAWMVAWLVVTSFLLRTAMSLFMVPYQAVGAELADEYDERTSVSAFRAAAALGGTLLASALSFIVFFPDTLGGADAKFSRDAYGDMGRGLAILMTASALIAAGGTWLARRRSPTAAAAPTTRFATRQAVGFVAGLAIAMRHPPLLALVASSSLFFLASVINASMAIHYLTYFAGIESSLAIVQFQLAFYVGSIAGVPAWLRLGRRLDKHRLYVVALLATAAMLACAFFAVGPGRPLGMGALLPLAIGNLLAGCCASAFWVLPASMVADVVDHDELITGERREGLFFGIASCGLQIGAGVALSVTGILLDRFAGLVPGQLDQSPMTIERIGLLFAILPAALIAGAGALMVGYRLTRQEVQRVQAQLVARRLRSEPRRDPLLSAADGDTLADVDDAVGPPTAARAMQ